MGYSWQVALGAVFISGSVFILLSLLGAWEKFVAGVTDASKNQQGYGNVSRLRSQFDRALADRLP